MHFFPGALCLPAVLSDLLLVLCIALVFLGLLHLAKFARSVEHSFIDLIFIDLTVSALDLRLFFLGLALDRGSR